MTPLVSVIIPCRNEARFIGPCIESVLASAYPRDRLEVIVADGMSDDGTREQIERYAARDPRVRCIDNPALTTPQALNRAIAAAQGELILRLDAHAAIAPDYIAQAIWNFEWSGADCVGGAMRTLGQGSGAFAKPIRISWEWRQRKVTRHGDLAWVFADSEIVIASADRTERKPYRMFCIFQKLRDRWYWRAFNGSQPVGSWSETT